jgi:hypothetical protein
MNLRLLTRRRRITGRHVLPVLEWAISCPSCELDVPGYGDENEAAYLAGIHNDLHHGSHPVALVVPISEPWSRPTGWSGDVA